MQKEEILKYIDYIEKADANVKKYLMVIRRSTDEIKRLLEEDSFEGTIEELLNIPVSHKPTPVRQPTPVPVPVVVEEPKDDRKAYLEYLMGMEDWPEAISADMLTPPNEEDQIDRANSVLDMMLSRSASGMHFLDFGTGDGWIAKEALNRGCVTSTGYDILASEKWKRPDGAIFTNVYKDLPKRYFDIVMAYDVLDHCAHPQEALKQIRSLVKDDGIVYVRCHPWTARHACHLHECGLNKAYIHLLMQPEELMEMGYTPKYVYPHHLPVPMYYEWFENAGFKVEKDLPLVCDVETYFYTSEFKNWLFSEQHVPREHQTEFLDSLRVEFVDYRLVPV